MSDLTLALKARRNGAHYALRIIRECRRLNLQTSLGFALVEQESGFTNVFGHDPTIYVGAGKVTRRKYLAYKAARGTSRMQGVGPCQLTWYATQDRADAEGGCWRPGINIRVGLETLAANIRAHRVLAEGIAAYNGTGPAATAYAKSVLAKRDRWHQILN